MTPLHRQGSDQLPVGVSTRETFLRHVDELLETACPSGRGIAYIRVMNLGSYGIREGSQGGEEIVYQLVDELVARLGPSGAVARDGGVSFLLLTNEDTFDEVVADLNESLFGNGLSYGGVGLKGGFCALADGVDARDILARARFAFESTKEGLEVCGAHFDKEAALRFDRRQYIDNHLYDAIECGEIRAYAQPIVRILTGRVCEVEILARWESKRFGTICPDEFVPELERTLQVHKLDATVFRLACEQWREAEDKGIAVPFGINLSRLDFELCDICMVLRDIMEEYDVPVEMVHIEVTESAAIGREDLLRKGVRSFREAGFKVYMDDFGTGYSSLAGLRDSNYDVVKLDKSLIDDVETEGRSRVVVADAIAMCKRLGMQTLCEGVESLEQLRFLRMVGCEKAQGFFFGKPAGHDRAMERLSQEFERYEEPGLDDYLDHVGRVNLFDGTTTDLTGIEASVFLGDTPVAIVEYMLGHAYCLTHNTAFQSFLFSAGFSSFEEFVGNISAGEGVMFDRFRHAARTARKTGKRQSVDLVVGGLFCMVGIEHLAQTKERQAYVFKASPISAGDALRRERMVEMAAPFLVSTYKRLDLFDLLSGTSQNIYLSTPLLRSHRMAGITISEVREFGDRNVHPADRARFVQFYDLSTLDDRIHHDGGTYTSIVLRVRVSQKKFSNHIFTLIPMSVEGRKYVLSTLRAADGSGDQYRISHDSRISDDTLLQALLDGIDRYVFWKDDQRRFLGANKAFLDYYGFESLDEIMGLTDDEVGWHVDNVPFRDDELKVLSGVPVLRARGTCYDRNELRKIEANKRPIVVSGEVVGLLGYFRDLGTADEERRPGD